MSDVPVADLILRNAKVVTFTASQPRAHSVAIKDGRVLAVGTDDELAPLAAAARHTADLGGRVVLPGLNDSHIHAMRGGLDWERTLHWEDVRSLAEALARVREAAARRQAGEWIRVVGGWHSRQLRENRLPTRAELDAAAPYHPVYLQELYDRAVLNSAALARCGWDGGTADPPGGRLLRDASGSLTGEVTGIGAFAVPSALAGTAGLQEQIRGIAAMMAAFAGHGLTGVVDGGGMATAPRDYDALYELWRRGGADGADPAVHVHLDPGANTVACGLRTIVSRPGSRGHDA